VDLLQAAGERAGRAQFLLHLGTVQIAAGRLDEAQVRYDQAGELARAGDDLLTQLWAAFFQGVLALYTGDRAAAEGRFAGCLTAWRGQGFTRGVASALTWQSEVARQGGRHAEAAALAREGLQISGAARDRPGIARSLRELGALAMEQGNLEEAGYLLGESCATFESTGRPWVYGRSRALLARLEVLQGRHGAARRGCAELLQLVRHGAAILLPEAAYAMALLLDTTGEPALALALLLAADGAPGEAATLAAAGRLRAELEGRAPAPQASAGGGALLPWLEALSRGEG
jgi:ATP/maltotriose-dependent transcriptional regulator MalT